VRRITSELYVDRAHHERFLDAIREHLTRHGVLRIADARGMTGLSRKYLVPLLEDLDRRGVTKRRGTAERILAGS
jgi:selenocysteine-specific elongation factor